MYVVTLIEQEQVLDVELKSKYQVVYLCKVQWKDIESWKSLGMKKNAQLDMLAIRREPVVYVHW